ncbi:MAG: hypothetical protein ACTTK0_08030 [Stomatobaculum sp.]
MAVLVVLIFILLIAAGCMVGCMVLNRKVLSAWQDKARMHTYGDLKPVCSVRDGKLYWELNLQNYGVYFRFAIHDPRPLGNLIGFIFWGGLAYIIFFTPYSDTYLPKYHSFKELDAGQWFLLTVFSAFLIKSLVGTAAGIFGAYPFRIIMERNAFTIQYKNGRNRIFSYPDIKTVKLELWRPASGLKEIFFPAFYFYDAGGRLICRAEVPDKESYLLLSEALKERGLYYSEPAETMETYSSPPPLGYRRKHVKTGQ